MGNKLSFRDETVKHFRTLDDRVAYLEARTNQLKYHSSVDLDNLLAVDHQQEITWIVVGVLAFLFMVGWAIIIWWTRKKIREAERVMKEAEKKFLHTPAVPNLPVNMTHLSGFGTKAMVSTNVKVTTVPTVPTVGKVEVAQATKVEDIV